MDVNRFIRNLAYVQEDSNSTVHQFGIERPLMIPKSILDDIKRDFVATLPWSNRYNILLVVANRLS